MVFKAESATCMAQDPNACSTAPHRPAPLIAPHFLLEDPLPHLLISLLNQLKSQSLKESHSWETKY